YDAVLAIDYDSVFSAEHIRKLMTAFLMDPTIDLLCPLQVRRGSNDALVQLADGRTHAKIDVNGRPFDIASGAFGLTMIRLSSLQRIPHPWFLSQPDAEGWGENRVDADVFFWRNCRKHGLRACCHPGVRIGHINETVFYHDLEGRVRW